MSFSGDRLVLSLCESPRTYEVGVTTSNAAPAMDDVLDRVRTEGEAFVEVSGFEATPSSTRAPSDATDGTVSIGGIRTLEARPDGCSSGG